MNQKQKSQTTDNKDPQGVITNIRKTIDQNDKPNYHKNYKKNRIDNKSIQVTNR